MDISSVLEELGLSDGEIKVYLALLKLGPIPVSKIKEESQLHRTTIYDFLEKLLNKGLINYIIRNNVKYYNASPPEKLFEYLKEKQDHLSEVLPKLQAMAKFKKEEVKVEVYKGKEGLKTVMLDCIRTGEDVIGIGIDEKYWKDALPSFIDQYQRMLKEKNIHERVITKINPDYLFSQDQTHYKFASSEFFSPLSTLVYKNKIQIMLWEPSITALLIENQKLADAYRKHFEALWNQKTTTFNGLEEIKSIFMSTVKNMKKEYEYLAFGIPHTSDPLKDFFDVLEKEKESRNIRSRLIFDERAKEQIEVCRNYKMMKVRILGKEYFSPAETNIFGDKILIILWSRQPQAFMIESKEISDSFKAYFEILWKTAKPHEW